MTPTNFLNDCFIEGNLFSEHVVQKISRPQMEWLFLLSDLSDLDEKQDILDYMKSDNRVYEAIPQSVKDEIERRKQR